MTALCYRGRQTKSMNPVSFRLSPGPRGAAKGDAECQGLLKADKTLTVIETPGAGAGAPEVPARQPVVSLRVGALDS